MTNENKPKATLRFDHNDTNGDTIKALVRYFTNTLCGDFILEQALKQTKFNNKKINDYKNKLINGASNE